MGSGRNTGCRGGWTEGPLRTGSPLAERWEHRAAPLIGAAAEEVVIAEAPRPIYASTARHSVSRRPPDRRSLSWRTNSTPPIPMRSRVIWRGVLDPASLVLVPGQDPESRSTREDLSLRDDV